MAATAHRDWKQGTAWPRAQSGQETPSDAWPSRLTLLPRGMREEALRTGDSHLPDPLLGGHFPEPVSIFRPGSRSEHRIAGRGAGSLRRPRLTSSSSGAQALRPSSCPPRNEQKHEGASVITYVGGASQAQRRVPSTPPPRSSRELGVASIK